MLGAGIFGYSTGHRRQTRSEAERQGHRWDKWAISVQHTEADIDRHLEAFAEIAPALAQAQHERAAVAAG